MNSFVTQLQRLPRLFPYFWLGLVTVLAVAVGRYLVFDLSNWTWLIQSGLFVVGAVLAQAIFLFEPAINEFINQIGAKLADEETVSPTSPVSVSNTTTATVTTHSWIRSNTILLILPILAFYLLSSSRSAIGFGFLFGLSLVYLQDIWAFSQGRSQTFLQQYFWTPPTPSYTRTLILGYLVYFASLTIALLVV